jgi:hypothetical protein
VNNASPETPSIENPTTAIPQRTSFWRRAARLYQLTALMVFNTLVLMVIVLVVSNIVLPKDLPQTEKTELTPYEMRPIGVNAFYSPRFNRNAY